MSENWRDEPGLGKAVLYKRRFAIFPTECMCGSVIWLKFYYKKYEIWGMRSGKIYNDDYAHTDYIGNITEEDYLVKKLAETL